MKKIYLTPHATVIHIQASQMIAESYKIYNSEIDADAMTKDEGDWDEVWDD